MCQRGNARCRLNPVSFSCSNCAAGSWVATHIGDWATHAVMEGGVAVMDEDGQAVMAKDWSQLFSVPMYAALACLVLMGVFYPRGKSAA